MTPTAKILDCRHSAMGDNKALPLKLLSQKLALLMALVASNRVSELQALDLRYHIYWAEGVVFTMSTLGKKRTIGAPPNRGRCLVPFLKMIICVL